MNQSVPEACHGILYPIWPCFWERTAVKESKRHIRRLRVRPVEVPMRLPLQTSTGVEHAGAGSAALWGYHERTQPVETVCVPGQE